MLLIIIGSAIKICNETTNKYLEIKFIEQYA